MALDLTSFAAAMKTLYTQKKVADLVYPENPLYALMPKETGFVGDSKVIPLIYGNPTASSSFSDALADTANSSLARFILNRTKKYSVAEIDNETIFASEKDAGAFISAAKLEIEGAMKAVTRRVAVNMYRTNGGAIGQLSADPSGGTTAVLNHYTQALNFETDMKLEADTVDGGGTKHTGSVSITAVRRSSSAATHLTASANWDTGISSIGSGDYLFVKGDYDNCMTGLDSYIPTTEPSDTLNSLNRALDPTRLGGQRVDAATAGDPIEEALVNLASDICQEGGNPKHCFVSYFQWKRLVNALGAKAEYDQVKSSHANVGFDSVKIYGPRGAIQVIVDQNCPYDRAYMLDLNTWKLCTMGGLPQIIDNDGLTFLRSASADAVQLRVGGYYELACMAPGHNGVALLQTS